MKQYTLDVLAVSGSPREMGQAQGEHHRAQIQRFVAVRQAALVQYAADRGESSTEGIMDIGRKSRAIFERWDPEGFAEHDAIAQGAQVDPLVLYTFTNMTDMRDALLLSDPHGDLVTPPDNEGCTSALVPPDLTHTGQALVGQTWDLNPTDVEFVVAIERRPTSGTMLRTWSLTCVGCLTLVGMNERGLAVGTTNIKVRGARPGVGYLDILHRAVRSETLEEASRWVEQAPRAGAHTYWIADAEQQIEWEAAPHMSVLRRTSEHTPVVRSNHCIAPEIAARQGEEGTSSSLKRLERISALTSVGDLSLDQFRLAFADRSDGVDSINRYPEDDQGTATNGIFIAEPATRQLWACRGPADRGVWRHHQF